MATSVSSYRSPRPCEEVTEDTRKLISAFLVYHTADIRAGTLKKIQKEKRIRRENLLPQRPCTRTTVVVASAPDVITVLDTIAVTIVGIHTIITTITVTSVMAKTLAVVMTSARATRCT
jgi:hypothetical protein